jgi:hypothetical protein
MGPRGRSAAFALATLLLPAAGACASPKAAPERTLARERYALKRGTARVGLAELEIATDPAYGWRCRERIERTVGGPVRIELDLCPDWTARSLRVVGAGGDPAGARCEVDPTTGIAKGGSGEGDPLEVKPPDRPPFGAVPLLFDSCSAAIPWIRAREWAVGTRAAAEGLRVSLDDGRVERVSLEVERLKDRNGRLVFRFKEGSGADGEVESDLRGLPLAWRRGDLVAERISEP